MIGKDGRTYTTVELVSTEQHSLNLVQHRNGDALRPVVPTRPAAAAECCGPISS